MNEWGVVGVLIALVGLFLTVGKPIIDLNSNIVKLNVSMETLNRRADKQEHDLEEQKAHAHESHKRLWDHNAAQDKKLDNHEKRLDKLESGGDGYGKDH